MKGSSQALMLTLMAMAFAGMGFGSKAALEGEDAVMGSLGTIMWGAGCLFATLALGMAMLAIPVQMRTARRG